LNHRGGFLRPKLRAAENHIIDQNLPSDRPVPQRHDCSQGVTLTARHRCKIPAVARGQPISRSCAFQACSWLPLILYSWFHSDQEHVIERLGRPSMNYLVYQVTIEDPKVLTKSWTSAPRRWTLGHEDLQEYFCTNNEELGEYQLLNEKGKQSQKNRN
jgi:hypothetical protein